MMQLHLWTPKWSSGSVIRVLVSWSLLTFSQHVCEAQQSHLNISDTSIVLEAGRSFAHPLAIAGGAAPYNVTLHSGNLPNGVRLTSSGVLSGIALELGSFPLSVTIIDSKGMALQSRIVITVESKGPVFLVRSFPPASIGAVYRFSLDVLSNIPVSFTLSEGHLPKGVELKQSGHLNGTPSESGSFVVGIRATDSLGRTADLKSLISVSALSSSLQISSLTSARAVQGLPYAHSLNAFGGTQPYQWSLEAGRLPNGTALDPSAGRIVGVPYVSGKFTVSIRVTDQSGMQSRKSIELIVDDERILPIAYVGRQYVADLNALSMRKGTVRLHASSSGSFPQGLTLTTDGKVYGAPAVQGVYVFNVVEHLADGSSLDSAWKMVILDSRPSLKISTLSIPAAVVGRKYEQALRSDEAFGSTLWTLKSGKIPDGLRFDRHGMVSGVPTQPGVSELFLEVVDSSGSVASAVVAVRVESGGGPSIESITDAASYLENGVTPGQLVSVFGLKLGDINLTQSRVVNNLYPVELRGTRVLFDGIAVPLVFTSEQQICAVVPFNLKPNTYTTIVVEYQGSRSASIEKKIYVAIPGIFAENGRGVRPVAGVNEDGTINTKANPARGGSVAIIYVNGILGSDMGLRDGSVGSESKRSTLPVEVTMEGINCEVLYAGTAPGLIAGIAQVNFRVPLENIGLKSVIVKVGREASPMGPALWVQ